jgi:hypothetical protein
MEGRKDEKTEIRPGSIQDGPLGFLYSCCDFDSSTNNYQYPGYLCFFLKGFFFDNQGFSSLYYRGGNSLSSRPYGQVF